VKETAPNVRTVITNKKNERENRATDGKKGESNMETGKKIGNGELDERFCVRNFVFLILRIEICTKAGTCLWSTSGPMIKQTILPPSQINYILFAELKHFRFDQN
jgi:hypothetical protein